MNGIKNLAKNIGFLTVGSLSTKFISFFLVPLYTNILTTEEYGSFDVINTTITILVPILTMNICDSVFRFVMDKNENESEIVTYSLKIFLCSLLWVCVFLYTNHIFSWIITLEEYAIYFILLFAVNSFNSIITNYARGKDRIFDISASGVVSSIITIVLNILMLVVLKQGIYGYFIANIVGILVQCIYLLISTSYIKHIRFQIINSKLKKTMLRYSRPLIVNNIAWWINSVSDRYIVIAFCGIAENGIYSIAYKIPSMISVFQSIFGQAWTLFAVQEYDENDNDGVFSKMYEAYNFCVVIGCAILIALNKPLAHFMYAKDFYEAWRYVPFLIVSSMFSALSAYLGGLFAAGKETKDVMMSTIYGAVVNIILNLILIQIMGALGAAIATAVSYFVVWISRLYYVRKIIDLKIDWLKDYAVYTIVVIQVILSLIIVNIERLLFANIVCIVVYFIIYNKVFGLIIKSVKKKLWR